METQTNEPVAWASPNVIPLRGLKDNHPAILTPFRCEANTVPLYLYPPKIASGIDQLKTQRDELLEALIRLEQVSIEMVLSVHNYNEAVIAAKALNAETIAAGKAIAKTKGK